MGPPLVVPLLIASTAIAAGSAVASGVRARNAAEFQADIARSNAALAEERGALEAERRRRLATRQIGALGARGASLDVIADVAGELELDALLAEFGGDLAARDARAAAIAAESRGQGAFTAGLIGAAGSIVGGLSSAGQLGLLGRTPGPGISTASSGTAATGGLDFSTGVVSPTPTGSRLPPISFPTFAP